MRPKMNMCGTRFMKYALILFNLIFAISGFGIIIAGAVVLSDIGEFQHFMEGRILAPPVVLIVAGAIVFIIALLGCIGAIRESYKLLIAFAGCLLVIFIIELAVGIAAAIFRTDYESILKATLTDSSDRYYTSKADRLAWDSMHINLECCGNQGPHDWPAKQRPFSCCHRTDRKDASPPEEFHCVQAVLGDDILYSEGCYSKLVEKAESASKILLGVGIGVAFVEVIGIVLALWMAHTIMRRDAKT